MTDAWRVVVEVPAGDAELVSDALWQHGALGIEEQDRPGGLLLLAGMPDREAAVTAADRIPGARAEPVEGDEWADAWRAWAKPSRVGPVLVQPAWLEPEPLAAGGPAPAHVIEIDPGRTFGSGSHPSTRLALGALLAHVPAGGRVLDVGCGSGVLAVAAAVAEQATVTGVDVDPAAVGATLANAARNEVAGLVGASTMPIDAVQGDYDVVVANVLAVTLREIAPAVAARVAPDGVLVLSGMLREQADAVAAAYARHGLVVVEVHDEAEWRALVLRHERP